MDGGHSSFLSCGHFQISPFDRPTKHLPGSLELYTSPRSRILVTSYTPADDNHYTATSTALMGGGNMTSEDSVESFCHSITKVDKSDPPKSDLSAQNQFFRQIEIILLGPF